MNQLSDSQQPAQSGIETQYSAPGAPLRPTNIVRIPSYLMFLGVLLIGIGGTGGYYFAKRQFSVASIRACTMEVKLCPDGTSVGKTGPNCEFAPCPKTTQASVPTPSVKKNPQTGWNIYENSIYGFSFDYPTNLKIEDSIINDSFTEYDVPIFGIHLTDPENNMRSGTDLADKYLSLDIEIYNNNGNKLSDFIANPVCYANNVGTGITPAITDECKQSIASKLKSYKSGVIKDGLIGDFITFENSATVLAFKKDGYVYLIRQRGLEGAEPSVTAEKIREQIIFSVRFL